MQFVLRCAITVWIQRHRNDMTTNGPSLVSLGPSVQEGLSFGEGNMPLD